MPTARRASLAVSLLAAACLASLYLGQENSYDFWNYHLYNAWAVMHDRWSHDLLAAGPPGFFSPYLDIPYYLAASALFPSHPALVVALAGLPYGALLCVLCLLANTLATSLGLGGRDRVVFVVVAVAFGGTGAGAWSMVGTTTNDISIAVLVVAALNVCLREIVRGAVEPSRSAVAVAGALVGAAVGLKLTAAIHGPAIAVVVIAMSSGVRGCVRNLVIFGMTATVAFVALYAHWGHTLYALTGNPFFPMFNGVFRSDWIASETLRDTRFLPDTWSEWLFYPFHWLTAGTAVTEVPFRDARPAMAYAATAALIAAGMVSRRLRAALRTGRHRPSFVIALFVAVSYGLWLLQFSIYRYLVATECVAGVLTVGAFVLAYRKLRGDARALPVFALAAGVAATMLYTISPQWRRAPVGANPFVVEAAPLEAGALVIFADQPMSFLAPGLAAMTERLRFMTIPRGFEHQPELHASAYTHELGRRMRAKVAANDAATFVLYNAGTPAPQVEMASFGLVLELERCTPGRSPMGLEFVVCPAVRSPKP